jgi:mercuric transport protein
MYKRSVAIVSIMVFVFILSAGSVSAAVKTVTLRVKGMTCGGCATTVEQALKTTEGVKEVRVSFERGNAVITYDDQRITVAKLREVINSTGFTCEMK